MDDGVRNQNVNNNERAQIEIEMSTGRQHRRFEPPPPYTPLDPTNHLPVINQPVQQIVHQPPFKDVPIYFVCPSCHKQCLTTIQFVNSHKTHMVAGFICGLTLWCMLCCLAAIPYVVQSFKKADHYCSNCNYYLGSYSKL